MAAVSNGLVGTNCHEQITRRPPGVAAIDLNRSQAVQVNRPYQFAAEDSGHYN